MLIDASLVLSNAQAVTASGASTHTIDQQAKGHTHHRCAFLARVEETFAGLTNLKISLQTSDTADFASAEELASVSAAGADLTAGQVLLKVPFPLGAAAIFAVIIPLPARERRGRSRCLWRTGQRNRPRAF